jgi:hypothetical protein
MASDALANAQALRPKQGEEEEQRRQERMNTNKTNTNEKNAIILRAKSFD